MSSRLNTLRGDCGQQRQQLELGAGELDRFALALHRAAVEVDRQALEAQRRAPLPMAAGAERRRTVWMRASSSRGSNGLGR